MADTSPSAPTAGPRFGLTRNVVVLMAWDPLPLPSLFAAVGNNLPPEKRAAGFGWQSVVRRIPTMVAPPLGGLLIGALGLAAGVRVGLLVTIGCCLLAVVILAVY